MQVILDHRAGKKVGHDRVYEHKNQGSSKLLTLAVSDVITLASQIWSHC